MRILLCTALALCLSACGGDDGKGTSPDTTTPDTTTPDTTSPDTTSPAPSDATAALPARTTPFNVGDTAGAFDALPEGKAVVVFYRGHW